MDIFPTIVDILGLSKDNLLNPIDGISLRPMFNNDVDKRIKKLFVIKIKGYYWTIIIS